MTQFQASAPGKLILSGEHSVVYGFPAISATVDLRLQLKARWNKPDLTSVKKLEPNLRNIGAKQLINSLSQSGVEVSIDSQIPIGAGMGSSAALSAVLAALLLSLQEVPTELDEINRLAFELECHSHGRPSGADNTVVVFGGLLYFQRTDDGSLTFKHLPISSRLPTLWVINTGRPDETTAEMVNHVRQLIKDEPQKRLLINSLGQTTVTFNQWLNLPSGDHDLIEIIRQNHAYLSGLGVVSKSTNQLINQIEKLGGAAKISGAGGRTTASGMVIAYHPDSPTLEHFLKSGQLDYFPVIITTEGFTLGDRL